MSKKEQKAAEPAKPLEGLARIKSITNQFKHYVNQQYQENVAYVPDAATVKLVTVSKWVEMPEAFAEAVQLPGLPIGNITHIYGKPNTGKTTLLMEAIVACQKQGIVPILILTEHKFDFTRIELMGGDPEAVLVFHADTIEQAYGFMEKILKDLTVGKLEYVHPETGEPVVIDSREYTFYMMMDSLGNTMSESEMEYEVSDWDKSMGKPAKAIKTLTRRVNNLLSKVRQQCGILLLNQSYQSMPQVGPSIETPYGGDGAPYSCVLNIRFRRKGDLKATMKGKDYVIGLETIIQVMKNHVSNLMPISSVFTVGSGMIAPTPQALEAYKKTLR